MVKKSVKIALFVGFVFCVVVSMGMFWYNNHEAIKQCWVEPDGNLLCVVINKAHFWQSLTIVTDEHQYSSGETVEVTMSFGLPSYAPKDLDAQLLITKSSNGDLVKMVDISNVVEQACPSSGCSNKLVTATFKAPTYETSYDLTLRVSKFDEGAAYFAESYEKIYEETTYFAVTPTTCTQNYCTSWTILKDTDHAEVSTRDCFEFGSAPTCTKQTLTEYKTICDSGYVIKGTTSTTTVDKDTTCVVKTTTTANNDEEDDSDDEEEEDKSDDDKSTDSTETDTKSDETGTESETQGSQTSTTTLGCPAYQALDSNGECSISFEKLFTSDGLKEFGGDFKWILIGLGVVGAGAFILRKSQTGVQL